MPTLQYRGVIALTFSRFAPITLSGTWVGDPSGVGALSQSYDLITQALSFGGAAGYVAPWSFFMLLNGKYNFVTISNSQSGGNTAGNALTGLLIAGHLITGGITSAGLVVVNDTLLPATLTNATIALNNLPMTTGCGTITGVVDTGYPMPVTLGPGDQSYGLPFQNFTDGYNRLALYTPGGVAHAPALFGALYDRQMFNACDVINGINYTYCSQIGSNNLQVWRFNPASGTITFSTYNEAILVSAPGTGISEFDKPTPYGFQFRDATLGLCLCDMSMQNYWQLQVSSPVSYLDQMTFDAGGIAYAFGNDGNAYWSGVPYLSAIVGAGGIPAGGAPVTGTGVTPQMILQVSNDGGRSWGNERTASLGALGATHTLVRWRRLGRSRNRCFRTICTENVNVALVAADLDSSR
jgi:hypothetical protein